MDESYDEVDGDTAPRAKVTVTIEVSGDSSEVVRVLDAVRAALADDGSPSGRGAGGDPAWWTAERATAFARRLKPPALLALRTIAAAAPSISVNAVQREMRRGGFAMTPGALSSIGFAVRALGSPAPFVRDNQQRVYRMDSAVAAALLPAAEAEHARRRPGPGGRREADGEE
jgi:hypothetical protein